MTNERKYTEGGGGVMQKEKLGDGDKMDGEATAATAEEDVVLPGFRFHPTDEELVGFYLRRKVDRRPLSIEIIKQIDIYKYDPWDLPKASVGAGDKEWYFFCLRGRKYRNSVRPNRVTQSGFWKATGIDRPIYSASGSGNSCIGLKKSLVYYCGSAGKGTKTDWMMHEFRLPQKSKEENDSNNIADNGFQEAETWTICRIFKRNVSHKKYVPVWSKDTSAADRYPTPESSSKSGSTESGTAYEYKLYFGASPDVVSRQDEKISSYNTTLLQTPTLTSSSLPSTTNTIDVLRDANWDELGRMMDFNAADPAIVYGYRYA